MLGATITVFGVLITINNNGDVAFGYVQENGVVAAAPNLGKIAAWTLPGYAGDAQYILKSEETS